MQFPRRFFHRAVVNAPVDTAWDVFTDHERMEEYTGSPCRIAKPGEKDRNGLGCVRVLGLEEHGIPALEEVVNYWKPHKLFGYHVIAGAPLSHHQGIVKFCERGPRQTEYIYDMRMTALPGIIEAMPDFFDPFDAGFRQFMKNAECECERRGAEADMFQVPALPALITERGGQLSD